MARGVSLHIGLNEVSPSHYRDANGNPWSGPLFACENDARDMAALAAERGFEAREPVLTSDAEAARVLTDISTVARMLEPGDMFLLTYSGHGGQVENKNPDDDPEDDKLDETWCLYDRQLLDDELFAAFAEFKPGVRILVLSDSCHSGTVARGEPPAAGDEARVKQLPIDVAVATEKAHEAMYDTLQREVPTKRLTSLDATVVLLSGCQDSQFSRDGRKNGAFTGALLQAWQDEGNRMSLPRLLEAVKAGIPAEYDQEPNRSVYCFETGPAFTI